MTIITKKYLHAESVMKKAKLITAIDNAMAANDRTTHTIEIFLVKSPRLGEKCGAIVTIKTREVTDIDWKKENVDPVDILNAQNEINQMTQEMVGDPEKFKKSDGRWIPFAIKRFWELFKKLGNNADLCIKAPQLKIRHRIPRAEILTLQHDNAQLFKTAFTIDILLDEFKYDPWSGVIRRGLIGAKK